MGGVETREEVKMRNVEKNEKESRMKGKAEKKTEEKESISKLRCVWWWGERAISKNRREERRGKINGGNGGK